MLRCFSPRKSSDKNIEINLYLYDDAKEKSVLELRDYISEKSKLYLVLLLSSAMGQTENPAAITKLGGHFEDFSELAIKPLLPANCKPEKFGSGGSTNQNYSGKLKQKVNKLAAQLKITVGRRIDDVVNEKNVGDGGIDWVGVVDFSDNESQRLFVFVQCACGENWIDKQYDGHKDIWHKILQFDTPPVNVFITPKFLRNADGKFSEYGKIANCNVFIDRLRFIELVKDSNELGNKLISIYSTLLNEVGQ